MRYMIRHHMLNDTFLETMDAMASEFRDLERRRSAYFDGVLREQRETHTISYSSGELEKLRKGTVIITDTGSENNATKYSSLFPWSRKSDDGLPPRRPFHVSGDGPEADRICREMEAEYQDEQRRNPVERSTRD